MLNLLGHIITLLQSMFILQMIMDMLFSCTPYLFLFYWLLLQNSFFDTFEFFYFCESTLKSLDRYVQNGTIFAENLP